MVVRPIDGLGTSITLGLMLVRTASQHSFARALGREVNRACPIEIERDAGLVRAIKGEDHLAYITPCQVMRFQWSLEIYRSRLSPR